MSRFMVMSSRANMPGSCKGGLSYMRVAVVELEDEFVGVPKMISDRARGVKRVVKTWERVYRGETEKCAFRRALAEARELVAQLGSETPSERG